ncbi:hypothetical protein D6764_04050 [Candidatus Woesearchaeota archaeon]|nr:MAG: hypothetical protein D6764_04050 [Candidatus Woesearchaeota archaeon]
MLKLEKYIKRNAKPAKRRKMHNYLFVFENKNEKTDVPQYELASLLRNRAGYGQLRRGDFSPKGMIKRNKAENLRPTPDDLPYSFKKTGILYPLEQTCILSSREPLDEKTMQDIIGMSGYIHSAGELLIGGKWDSISLSDIEKALKEIEDGRIGIEMWTEKNMPSEGLEGIAIDSRRYMLDNLPIMNQFARIQERYELVNVDRVVTLIKDVHHGGDTWYHGSGDDTYLLAFSPQIRKFSPLQELDENKPYWKGIDTTPQQLMAAMLNLAGLKSGGYYLDVFGGMGTSMIEATKDFPAKAYHNDIMEVEGALDNFRFLTMNPDKMLEVVKNLSAMRSSDRRRFEKIKELATLGIDRSRVGSERAYPDMEPSAKILREEPILRDNFENRLMFYLIRRGLYREADLDGGLYDKVSEILESLRRYAENMYKATVEHPEGVWKKNGVIYTARAPRNEKGVFQTLEYNVMQKDAFSNIPESSIDAIVTDPPYGFGTDANPQEIVNTYENFLRHAFRILKNGGGLSFCVLDKVKTGKEVNEMLTSEGIKHMIDRVASENDVGIASDTFEGEDKMLYWKSKHKLIRGIVNIKVAK